MVRPREAHAGSTTPPKDYYVGTGGVQRAFAHHVSPVGTSPKAKMMGKRYMAISGGKFATPSGPCEVALCATSVISACVDNAKPTAGFVPVVGRYASFSGARKKISHK